MTDPKEFGKLTTTIWLTYLALVIRESTPIIIINDL